MNLEQNLRAFVLELAPVTALVTNRVYGLIREQASDLPAVMIQRIATSRFNTVCGTDRLLSADMQVDSYAMTGDDAWALALALKLALRDFSGNMGDSYVDHVFLNNEFPLTDPEPGIIRVTQLYNFWYQENDS